MRELLAVLLAVALVSGGLVSGQAALRNWIDARSAAAAGASMAPFLAAARDYLEANYETVAARVPLTGDVTFIAPSTLVSAGLLSSAWKNAAWGGQRHALAVRRQSTDSLLALAYTHGGRPLPEDDLMLAARAAPVGMGYISSEFPTKAVSAAGDWEVTRGDFTGSATDPALTDGHLATVLFAHRGRVLGPWLCRSEVPGRPECNEMTAALRIALPSGSTLAGADRGALEVIHDSSGEHALAVTGSSRLDGAVEIAHGTGSALVVQGSASVTAHTGTALAVTGTSRLDGTVTVEDALTVNDRTTVSGTVFARNFRVTSDPRRKQQLTPVACTPELRRRLEGITLYQWRWQDRGDPGLGYDAREVAARFPDLVARDGRGVMHVDYTALAALQHACARARPTCPAGTYSLERFWPAAVTTPSGTAGQTVYLQGPPALASCSLVRARCVDPDHGHHGWRIACAPAARFGFWPEPVLARPTGAHRKE